MIGTVDIKYTYNHYEKSFSSIEKMNHDLLVPIMIFVCEKI